MDFSHSCMAILAVYFFLSELWACVSFKGFFCVLGAVELLGIKLFIMCSCDPFPTRPICHRSPLLLDIGHFSQRYGSAQGEKPQTLAWGLSKIRAVIVLCSPHCADGNDSVL